ncbi:universal stress protein [Allofranklinella schreckenbergeri]|uniref:Universal stress protein n=1 Tax=Allofranklinella schreckenbergeri TaxID=1076744 RepID=A0A3M6Q876_9BURK|nr:universal stress protein [Allofranklinella schreckenbergeri]RMW99014.1 universal stress protein [Allofranklinella schreckenbergeri]
MYAHIMVPIDGTPTSQCAIRHAKAMAQAFGSSILLLYVIDPYPFTGIGTDLAYGQAQYVVEANDQAQQALQQARQELEAQGIPVETLTLEGSVVQNTISQVVQERDISLIVMASHGRSGLEKLLLGSTTDRVLGAVHVPVLVVRRPADEPEDAPQEAA